MIQYLRGGVFLHTGTQEHFDSLVRSGRWSPVPDHQIPYDVALEMADRLDAIAKKPKRQSTGTNERGQNCWAPNEPHGRACRPKGKGGSEVKTKAKKPRVSKADIAKKIAEKKAAAKAAKPKKQTLRSLMKEHGIDRKEYESARGKMVQREVTRLEKRAKSGKISEEEAQSRIGKIQGASNAALSKKFGGSAVKAIVYSRWKKQMPR